MDLDLQTVDQLNGTKLLDSLSVSQGIYSSMIEGALQK